MNFKNKNILIMGYGKSGKSAVNLLQDLCKNIFVYDNKFTTKILKNNKNKLKNNYFCNYFNNNIYFINNLDKLFDNHIHFCILSPGISLDCKEVKIIKKHNIRIISELELGSNFCKGKIFAITGTNGKTTSVNLLYQIFKQAKKECFLCGNVGTPISEIAKQTTTNSLIVCEVSSFQLESTKNFKPFASCILNLSPDHLDRHITMDTYTLLKNKINNYYKTKKVFNIGDKNVAMLSKKYFNSLNFSIQDKKYKNLINDNNLIGEFNKENMICCCIMAKLADIKEKDIKLAIKNFIGLPHRLKLVGEYENIKFINDSKSTNILSTQMALQSVGENVILLLGGSKKNLDFTPIFKSNNIDTVIAYGETKDNIKKCNNEKQMLVKNTFTEAVQTAFKIAKPFQTILLSPACASFDEFTSYEQRGELFEKLVEEFIQNNKKIQK